MSQNWILKSSYLTKLLISGFVLWAAELLLLAIIFGEPAALDAIQKFFPKEHDELSRFKLGIMFGMISFGQLATGLLISMLTEITVRWIEALPYQWAQGRLETLKRSKYELDRQRIAAHEFRKQINNYESIKTVVFSLFLISLLNLVFICIDGAISWKRFLLLFSIVCISVLAFLEISRQYWLTAICWLDRNHEPTTQSFPPTGQR